MSELTDLVLSKKWIICFDGDLLPIIQRQVNI